MSELNHVTLSTAPILTAAGPGTFLRGQAYFRAGAVASARWVVDGHIGTGTVAGTAIEPYDVSFTLRRRAGRVTGFSGDCSCPVGIDCKHAVALALSLLGGDAASAGPPGVPAAKPRAWEAPLVDLVREDPGPEQPRVALLFDVTRPSSAAGALRVGLRPVVPGRNGGWVRGDVSWQMLSFSWSPVGGLSSRHAGVLKEIAALEPPGSGYYYGGASRLLYLDEVRSRAVWDLLAEAGAVGIPLVTGPKGSHAVQLAAEPARLSLEILRDDGALVLTPKVSIDGDQLPVEAVQLVGHPPHGVAVAAAGEPAPREGTTGEDAALRLAALADRLDPALSRVLERGRLRVPGEDEPAFFERYFPALQQRMTVVAADPSVELPRQQPPVLVLTGEHDPDGDRLTMRWRWRYAIGAADRLEPLWPPPGVGPRGREAEQEAVVTKAVGEVIDEWPQLGGERLAETATLSGLDALRFLSDVVPRLAELDDVAVELPELPAFRETTSAPEISVRTEQAEGETDWYDLSVRVAVDGEEVPFDRLFVALATGQPYLVLPSGTWFTLDRPELVALAELIEEARALNERGPAGARVSRYQNDLWEELERLGLVAAQAAGWRAGVRGLASLETLPERPLPAGLHATLRPYQAEGFAWLALLHEHGLGGVLADEMGLGKTVQTIALVCAAKESGERRPFLVVAPTSVVHNWAAECRRFAPDLEVRCVNETARKSGVAVAAAAEGADVLVTSYALFRLDHDGYAGVAWAGLVLDEAQFVKNPQSRGYLCAKKLPAPFKLAITGTPMENNLTELWSLLSITAPGLFPHPRGFDEHFRHPIEKHHDSERLAVLRRRIAPFLLRRTKEMVAADLPPKQEQVIELPLHPKHRRIYQTHLQRERQKVLGLLDDLDGNRFEIFRSLTLLRQACLDPALIDESYAGTPATKLDVLMEMLDEIVSEGHRVLVFSQFTRFLDAARRRLDNAAIDYCYLDGTTKRRDGVITRFREGGAPVFLISLKAGGFGLTLTEADYCILLDPWWNPATENQAVDRTHRIGQTRNVMVYRLVAEDTIEEKVMALKARKAALFASVLAADGAAAAGRLTAADIRGILE